MTDDLVAAAVDHLHREARWREVHDLMLSLVADVREMDVLDELTPPDRRRIWSAGDVARRRLADVAVVVYSLAELAEAQP